MPAAYLSVIEIYILIVLMLITFFWFIAKTLSVNLLLVYQLPDITNSNKI